MFGRLQACPNSSEERPVALDFLNAPGRMVLSQSLRIIPRALGCWT